MVTPKSISALFALACAAFQTPAAASEPPQGAHQPAGDPIFVHAAGFSVHIPATWTRGSRNSYGAEFVGPGDRRLVITVADPAPVDASVATETIAGFPAIRVDDQFAGRFEQRLTIHTDNGRVNLKVQETLDATALGSVLAATLDQVAHSLRLLDPLDSPPDGRQWYVSQAGDIAALVPDTWQLHYDGRKPVFVPPSTIDDRRMILDFYPKNEFDPDAAGARFLEAGFVTRSEVTINGRKGVRFDQAPPWSTWHIYLPGTWGWSAVSCLNIADGGDAECREALKTLTYH